MALARVVILSVTVEGRSKSEVARDFGVSRRWVQKLCTRYATEGEAALEPRSRRPRRSPKRTSVLVEDAIVELRKDLEQQGLDAGAATIRTHLEREGVDPPSVATIWRVLSRRGFVTPQPHKRPRSSIIRFQAVQPNERWQADVTHVALRGGREVEVLNQLDDHSRLLVGSDARSTFRSIDVVECLGAAVEHYGAPKGYLTDNGGIFTGAYRGLAFVAFERELIDRGIEHRHSRPYHPQTCGKVERFHQTVKKWLDKQPRARSVVQLQDQLDEFRSYYNEVRPHRALRQRTPLEAFEALPKAVPADGPLAVGHFRVRHDVVSSNGTVTLRYASRLHHVGLGRVHVGRRVLILTHDLRVRVLDEEGAVIRNFTLDPSKNYQRLEMG
jgi:transposase InsO family protein